MKKLFLLCFLAIIPFIFAACQEEVEKINSYMPTIPIMGRGEMNAAQMTRFFLSHNPYYAKDRIMWFANVYIQEASMENVNWDLAFCQMCLETKYLSYGGQVNHAQNNFAGMGATDDGAQGLSFRTVREGVRAQIQHLKAYASCQPLNNPLVDPRFTKVQRGSARYVSSLGNGNWASDPYYSYKLTKIIDDLHSFRGNII